MGSLSDMFPFGQIIFIIIFILSGLIIIFAVAMILSPKLRGKIMSKQLKAVKYMTKDSKDDLEDIVTTMGKVAIDSKKRILDENENTLKDMATKEANINSEGMEITARAIKKGFTKDDKGFCRYCGTTIEQDSIYCSKCGKKQ